MTVQCMFLMSRQYNYLELGLIKLYCIVLYWIRDHIKRNVVLDNTNTCLYCHKMYALVKNSYLGSVSITKMRSSEYVQCFCLVISIWITLIDVNICQLQINSCNTSAKQIKGQSPDRQIITSRNFIALIFPEDWPLMVIDIQIQN